MSTIRGLKRIVHRALASDPMTTVLQPLTKGVASVMMLHRFADPERQNEGHDADTLRSHLAYLRRKRYELVGVGDLATRLQNRDARLAKTVAFTVDDGYADYATVGARVFEEFDCPVTVFVVTGVVDERGWYWWDRLRVTLETAGRRMLALEIAGGRLEMQWSDSAGAAQASRTIVDRMKGVTDAERHRILDEIPRLVDAEVPAIPPPRYAALTWDEIRACAAGVSTFGPHTVTHPILARTDDATARREIETSWRRLASETTAAIPVFCYPNGGKADLGAREMAILREVGMTAAVTSQAGYATVAGFHHDADARFLVPRFPYDGYTPGLVQTVNGAQRVKLAVRRAMAGRVGG